MESEPEWKWSGTERFKWLCLGYLGFIGLVCLVLWLHPAQPDAAPAPPSVQLPAR